jgi:hypothetical protein
MLTLFAFSYAFPFTFFIGIVFLVNEIISILEKDDDSDWVDHDDSK